MSTDGRAAEGAWKTGWLTDVDEVADLGCSDALSFVGLRIRAVSLWCASVRPSVRSSVRRSRWPVCLDVSEFWGHGKSPSPVGRMDGRTDAGSAWLVGWLTGELDLGAVIDLHWQPAGFLAPRTGHSARVSRRRCHIKMFPPWKMRPGKDNHGIDTKISPAPYEVSRHPSRSGGRRKGRILPVNNKLSVGGDFSGGRSYHGAPASETDKVPDMRPSHGAVCVADACLWMGCDLLECCSSNRQQQSSLTTSRDGSAVGIVYRKHLPIHAITVDTSIWHWSPFEMALRNISNADVVAIWFSLNQFDNVINV